MSTRMRESNGTFKLFILVVVVIAILFMLFYVPRKIMSRGNAPKYAEDIRGGVPVQRARIDAFIGRVAALKNYDVVVDSLNDDAGAGIIAVAGMYSSDHKLQTNFSEVLADRRVAKLYEMLAKMKSDDAEKAALEIFEKKLAIHVGAFNTALDEQLRDGIIHYKMIRIRYNNRALAAACFLLAGFSNGQRLVEAFEKWGQKIDDCEARLQKNPELLDQGIEYWFEMHGRPQNLFMVNCYVMYLEKRHCFATEETKEIKGLGALCRFDRQPYLAWDAHTLQSDFTHMHRGIDIDQTKALGEISVAASWGSRQFKDDAQLKVVEYFREMAKSCSRN